MGLMLKNRGQAPQSSHLPSLRAETPIRKLDFVLGLTTAKIMERRLQTKAAAISLWSDLLCLNEGDPSVRWPGFLRAL